MKKRILITGASGTGKTTLANHISQLYGLPFISSSPRELWHKYQFNNHKEVVRACAMDPEGLGKNYQIDILENRINKLKGLDKFISDRSFVDNIAYFLMGVAGVLTTKETKGFISKASKNLEACEGLIYLRWNDDMIQGDFFDGCRIENLYYQKMVDWVIEGCLKSHRFFDGHYKNTNTPLLVIDTWDLKTRIKMVHEWVQQ